MMRFVFVYSGGTRARGIRYIWIIICNVKQDMCGPGLGARQRNFQMLQEQRFIKSRTEVTARKPWCLRGEGSVKAVHCPVIYLSSP